MYTLKNTHPYATGHWTTEDGEYEFLKSGKTWTARHRAHWNGRSLETLDIGTGATLTSVFGLAARHSVTPAGWL